MKSIFVISCILIVNISTINAQVSQQWAARYNGSSNNSDYANDIAINVAGDIYVTGASYGANNDLNYMTIKYSSSGTQLWTRTYDGLQGEDVAEAIVVDFLGNAYVTGRISVSGSGYNYYTIKMNSAGTVQWGANYNGPGNSNDIAHSIAVDGTGNVYVGGESTGSGTGLDYCLIKYNSNGVQQWVLRYNAANLDDVMNDLKIDPSGNNLFMTGYCDYGSPAYRDYLTIRCNSLGTVQWTKRYTGGTGTDEANAIAIDGSGNVFVTGFELDTWESYTTVKYNSSGVQQWVGKYNGPGNRTDIPSDIEVDGSGNVYITGKSAGINLNNDYCTIKYNSSGTQQWANRYTGTGSNQISTATSLKLDATGNIYVGGSSGPSLFLLDYALVRYNPAGTQQWAIKYNGTGNGIDQGYALAIDGSGNVFITGGSYGSNSDFATIKYGQTVGVQQVSGEIPEKYVLSQNYPNPFNPSTQINFSLPNDSFVKITVFDALGKEVEKLADKQMSAGNYKIDFDASKLTSGIYFYKIQTDEFTDTKKMILVK